MTSTKTFLETFRLTIVERHNELRGKHNSEKLIRNAALDSRAQEYADRLLTIGCLEHSEDNDLGENLGFIYNVDFLNDPKGLATKVCNIWYSEVNNFDFLKPKWSPNSGHFSQMIWKSSKEIGVGLAYSSNGTFYIVARYFPPGNIFDQYKENVSST